jgi:tetratricopeptide (TPR) repeat protein
MKKIVLFLMMMLPMAVMGQSNKDIESAAQEMKMLLDSIRPERKVFFMEFMESIILAGVDSLEQEGMFNQALETCDSLSVQIKKMFGMAPSAQLYLEKAHLLQKMEEYNLAIATIQEYFDTHKDSIDEKRVPLLYHIQGNSYRNLGDYREAIGSYEKYSMSSKKIGKLENQAISFCDMAYCYTKIGKYVLARTCYEKGLQVYLDYFGVKRYMLLKGAYNEKDSYRRKVLAVFANHLFEMAVFEQEFGSKTDKKEYLLMSAHCGNVLAKEEYKRIYGRY